jgi:integrase
MKDYFESKLLTGVNPEVLLGDTLPVDHARIVDGFRQLADTIVMKSLANEATRRVYRYSLDRFFVWFAAHDPVLPFGRAAVQNHTAYLRDDLKLAPATCNIALAAIKKLAVEAYFNRIIDNYAFEGVRSVRSVKPEKRRLANWLTLQQVNQLLALPDTSLKGHRDRLMLAIMIGCGLRRDEVCSLTPGSVTLREDRWVLIVKGKGQKLRYTAIPKGVKQLIDVWIESVKGRSPDKIQYLLCACYQGGYLRPDKRLHVQTMFDVVRYYGDVMGIDKLSPHDLRRTHARLARDKGMELDQIQAGLGHSSVVTTQRYIGDNQDLRQGPGDVIDADWTGGKG